MIMMMKLIVSLIFLAAATLAHAEIRQSEESIHLSVPGTFWEIRFPKHGWQLTHERVRQNGRACYYTFSNTNSQLHASFSIEPAEKCKTSQDCRSMYLNHLGPYVGSPQSIEQFEENGFAVVKYIVPYMRGIQVNQLNYSGHMVRDGYSVDIYLYKMQSRKGDETFLSNFIKAVSSQRKSALAQTVLKK